MITLNRGLAALVFGFSVAAAAPPSFAQKASAVTQDSGEAMAVMVGGRMIGRDPDPWIRNELRRHSHSGYAD